MEKIYVVTHSWESFMGEFDCQVDLFEKEEDAKAFVEKAYNQELENYNENDIEEQELDLEFGYAYVQAGPQWDKYNIESKEVK